MTLASPKGFPTMSAIPRTLSSIAVSVAGLALFLILASCLLISHPIGSTVRGYFYDVDHSSKLDLPIVGPNQSTIDDGIDKNPPSESTLQVPVSSSGSLVVSEKEEMVDQQSVPVPVLSSGSTQKEEADTSSDASNVTEDRVEIATPVTKNKSGNSRTESNGASPDSFSYSKVDNVPSVTPIAGNATKTGSDDSGSNDASPDSSYSKVDNIPSVTPIANDATKTGSDDSGSNQASPDSFSYSKAENMPSVTPIAGDATKTGSDDSGCDLYHGHWYYDSTGPLYTNNTCPNLTQMQNCQGNGRPDKEYENWRWKPSQCDLPRFDAKKFMELMRGKTLAFIGDSVARNQMESMLCILWQVETPKNRGNRRMQRWYFRSTDVMIVRIWSSWLVHQTSEPFDFAPEGVTKLHLDAPDEGFLEFIPKFDVVVLSSGHWFAKQSVYILNNEIVGGQLWWPDNSRPQKINNIEAFEISVETILTTMVTHPNYTGLTIVRSYSPDHYEGGAWNTGGSCTGKVRPVADGKLVENEFTKIMHEKQVTGFNRAIKKQSNKSKLRLMDITEAFSYRHDGHPGPYRSPDPNKITKRGPDGRPPPQDCLHWCMPGAVDTWNELVLEIIRRDFEGNPSFSS